MDLYTRLRTRFPRLALGRDFSFARNTTIGCGGTAEVWASPADGEEAAALLRFLGREGIPLCFLGAGANVLPADGRFAGVAVLFRRMNALAADGECVLAGAGVTGGSLLRFAEAHALGGFEFLTGIPATLGGAAVMKAGVGGRHLCDVAESVIGIEGGVLRRFTREECAFAEKQSVFQSGIAVVAVRLRGRASGSEEIAAARAYYRARRAHLPKGRSMGCVFVNPPACSAGALIEACGLKGYAVNGARVSPQHANFILNEGASSSAVAALIRFVKEEVFRKTGVLLREEIRYIP